MFGSNSYITPNNFSGFAPHFDDVEVFGEIIPAKNGILARIADKLKRLESENLEVSESKGDTIKDLIGYLVILLILDNE